MSDCTSGIAKNITSNCTTQPVGGLEAEAYIGNRSEMSITYDDTYGNMITDISMASGTKLYKITGTSKNLSAGHERSISDDLDDTYTHKFNFKGFEFDSESVLNLDNIKDVVVIVNYKNKVDDGDGVLVAYGAKCGLYVSADSRSSNESNGIRSLELSSADQQTEPYSQYNVISESYSATLEMLEALLEEAE